MWCNIDEPIFYGYEEEASSGDEKLLLLGGKMTGDIDMSINAMKNVPAAIDDTAPMTNGVLEQIYLKMSHWRYVFFCNVDGAVYTMQTRL